MYDENAVLLVVENGKDEDGFPAESLTEYPIYVRESSATRNEFYEALRAGINVKIVLKTRLEDWENTAHLVGGKREYATRVQYNGGTLIICRNNRKQAGERKGNSPCPFPFRLPII